MSETQTLRGDMPIDGWVDRLAPAAIRPYVRLMRLDRPIGAWLLLFPCWWSTALAADRWPNPLLMAVFLVGAFIMRGAGCTFNDIVDRDFDAKVARTASRPIPSGEVSVRQAVAFMGLQLALGLALLLTFNRYTVMLGVASLLLVFTYPFMKRITYWPQAWLGLTFNWGALMGTAAVLGRLDPAALALYAAGWFWTLGYDTIYAHQDKDDDLLVGVKSTALKLGAATPRWCALFYTLTILLTALAGALAGLHWWFFAVLGLAAIQLVWQVTTLDLDETGDCLAKFKSNRNYAWIVLAAMVAGKVL